MRALSKFLITVAASVALASCGGGGGGSGNGGIANPPSLNVSVTSASATSTPSSIVPITVRVTGSNGANLPDGTTVTLRTSPASVAVASHSPVNVGPNDTINVGEAVTGQIVGGVANFRLHTRAVGTVQVTASVQNPSAPAQSQSGSTSVAVNAGPGNDTRLTLQVQNPTIPKPPNGYEFFWPSFYQSLVTVTQRRLDGTLVNGSDDQGGAAGDEHCNGGSGAAAAIGVGLDSAALFLPAEGIEDEENADGTITRRFFVCRSVSLGMNSGTHDFYVVAFDRAGQVQLRVTAEDPQTGETLSQEFLFNVGGVPQIPASIQLAIDNTSLYITGVNGLHSSQLQVGVFDGLGSPVPNPATGVNNLLLEIVNGGQGGERLRGTNALGAVVQGNSIAIRTANGVGPAQFDAGTIAHTVTLRATSDRADNNVDNGIQDPVTITEAITVSDGRVFEVQLSENLDQVAQGSVTTTDGGATYLMLVSATLNDSNGASVPAGTQVRFGLVDEPQANGVFQIAGNDGNPQELGTTFIAPTGQFITAAGGPAGLNTQTLLVFAEDTEDYDMESARQITSVQSETQLTVNYRFNANDGRNLGSTHDATNLPYIIGRARDGAFVPVTATTNDLGVATAVLRYPRSALGKRIAIYAQANGAFVNGSPELVTDVEFARYQGQGPLQISAPDAILANRTEVFDVCVRDANFSGIQGVQITYNISPLPGVRVNGSPAVSGPLPGVTDADGCIEVTVQTANILDSGTVGTIVFTAEGATATTDIEGPTGLRLTANPSQVLLGELAGTFGVSLRLTDGVNPIAGATITGTCSGAGMQNPGALLPTNTAGQTSATVNFAAQSPRGTGTCEFTAGTASVTVDVGPGDCTVPTSPPRPGC